jgi:hypothetical protein
MTTEAIPLGTAIPSEREQKLAIIVPVYIYVSSKFFTNFSSLLLTLSEVPVLKIMQSVYPAQAMRHAIADLLQDKSWERILVIETDMVMPPGAFLAHAHHTDDIVGSTYFQHAPPFQMNVMFRHPTIGKLAHPTLLAGRHMIEHPALYSCAVVGLGCTSIARRVCEEWPADVPMFRTDYLPEAAGDEFTHGEISHDVWFGDHADALGFHTYLDTSIVCSHLTEGWVDAGHYLADAARAEKLAANGKPSGIVVPNRAERRRLHVAQN